MDLCWHALVPSPPWAQRCPKSAYSAVFWQNTAESSACARGRWRLRWRRSTTSPSPARTGRSACRSTRRPALHNLRKGANCVLGVRSVHSAVSQPQAAGCRGARGSQAACSLQDRTHGHRAGVWAACESMTWLRRRPPAIFCAILQKKIRSVGGPGREVKRARLTSERRYQLSVADLHVDFPVISADDRPAAADRRRAEAVSESELRRLQTAVKLVPAYLLKKESSKENTPKGF